MSDYVSKEYDKMIAETKKSLELQKQQRLKRVEEEQTQIEETELAERQAEIDNKKLEILNKIEETLNDEPTGLTKAQLDIATAQRKDEVKQFIAKLEAKANLALEAKRQELLKLESNLKVEISNINKTNQIAPRVLEALKEVQQQNMGNDYSVVFVVNSKDGLMKFNYIIYPKMIEAQNIRIVKGEG